MLFGEILKKEREEFGLSVKKLSELSSVSTTYISKLENQKRNFPRIETIYNLLFGFKSCIEESFRNEKLVEIGNPDYLRDLLKMFILAEDSNIKDRNIDLIYKYFESFYEEKLKTILSNNSKIKDKIFENKIEQIKGTNEKVEINKPFYDLNWLLSQNEYDVFFGREFILDNNLLKKKILNEREMYFYNVLNDEDLHTIKNLILTFLENKYYKVKKDKTEELFNIFTSNKNIECNQFVTNYNFVKLLKDIEK
ncbi:helix-turn-helix domain-containing protein [Staphylococcus pseudintermedius]|uniref:helix-turn-helix domain-containing protein n=1 Tax=Staphylococcus pseudintermedius TaxID=283734 RepID=UPI001C1F5257|nr:helix-turn-helix transcriptional regulator [Staphylococcus pseudintermedius]